MEKQDDQESSNITLLDLRASKALLPYKNRFNLLNLKHYICIILSATERKHSARRPPFPHR